MVILGGPGAIHWGFVFLFAAIAIGCFVGVVYGSPLQGRDAQYGLRAVLVTTGLWVTFQALGLLTADENLSSALYIGGLIWGLTGVGAWVYFVSAYTGRSYHQIRRYRGLALGVYAGLVAIKLTNPLYGLYVSTRLQPEPYPHLVVEPQLFYWVSFSLTYTLVAISFYWLLDAFRDSSSPTVGLGALAVLSLVPVVPRVAVEVLPEALPPVFLGLSFEPIGVAVFVLGVLVFVEEPFRRVERSARSKFFEEADDATFVYNVDGNLVETNERAQRLRSELAVDCSTIEAFEDAFSSVDEADGSEPVPVEHDGSTRYFDITVNPITVGAENVGTVASVREATARRERKRDLELKERAMDEANVGITISDPNREDNPLVYVNDGFVDQTGYSREESLGRNCRFLQGDDRDQSALDDLRDAIASEEDITVELRNYRADGEQFWNRLSVTPVYDDDGELVNHVGIQQDVTDIRESQRELRAERERFQLLIENVDEYAFFLMGADGDIQTWNEGAKTLFGYESAAVLGTSMARLHTESDREASLPDRLLQQARLAGESSDDGWRVRADGSEFYADVRYTALEDDDGAFRGYAQIVRDMTEQRRQRRRTERFVEESDDVVTIVDLDGTITYASGSADRVVGYAPDDLVDRNLFDQLHPDDREAAMRTFFDGTERPEAEFQIDCRFDSRDDGWRDVELRCRNMRTDDAIDGMLLYLRDVTETNERTRRLEALFNGTFSFTGLLEPDGTVIKVNDAALTFGGFDRGDVVGQPFYEVPWWTHSADVTERLRNALDTAANGEFVRYETDVNGKAGLETIDFSVKPVTNDAGEVTLLVVEGREITAQRRQQQHMAMIQRIMRHNMRNDLNKVRGWAQFLADESDPADRRDHLDRIEAILDEWTTMIEGLKQIRQLTDLGETDRPTATAQSVVDGAIAWSREAHPELTIEAPASDAETASVPAAVEEALKKLIELVADRQTSGESHGGEVRVDVSSSDSAGGWIEFEIWDAGSRLTEMETKVLATGEETTLVHAQGIDVWIVRTLITEVGGEITTQTTDDGTSVRFRVPMKQPARSAEV